METFIELKGQHRIWQQQLLNPGESGLIASGWDEQGHVIIKFPVIVSNFKKSTTKNPRSLNVRKTKISGCQGLQIRRGVDHNLANQTVKSQSKL